MAAPVIRVRDVRHMFKDRAALRGISFDVERGSLHGFVGPNGAGKTTALKLICTLLPPQTGRITVFGHDVLSDVHEVRRRIGFMPDHFSMYRQMTVFEYLDFFGAAYGLLVEQRNQVIGNVLELTDMAGRRDSLIQGLSRGMQQRVSLARVLINDPDLLLLDEPASGLDPRARIELMDILRALQGMGKTVFISSHILSELAQLCDSVTIIDRGTIKYSGSIDALARQETGPRTFELMLDRPPADCLELLKRIPGIASVDQTPARPLYRLVMEDHQTEPNQILQGLIEAKPSIVSFVEQTRHLNQAFMDLTEGGVS
jgi:ABC-2 type transport system ATP-binding protein